MAVYLGSTSVTKMYLGSVAVTSLKFGSISIAFSGASTAGQPIGLLLALTKAS